MSRLDGTWLDPFFLAHRALKAEVAELGQSLVGTVVDVGCGNAPYRALIPASLYVGVERAASSASGSRKSGASVLYDGQHLPFADATFDGALCSQVLEHVFEPEAFLREMRRVLRDDGVLLLTVPFVWAEHEQPYDFARYSSYGLVHLASSCGFEVITHRKTLAGAGLVVQVMLGYMFETAHRWPGKAGRIAAALAALALNPLGIVLQHALPLSDVWFLDHVVLLSARSRSGSAPIETGSTGAPP